MKTVRLLLLLLWPVMVTLAQSTGHLNGQIVDHSTGNPIAYSTIYLLNATDSTLVKGNMADDKGKFTFTLAPGMYRLRATQVGYGAIPSQLVTIRADATEPVRLQLTEETTLLKELAVIGQKPFIEQQIDKIVINVENSIVSAGNNALDVLGKLPGVMVDSENRISLQGRSGVSVMVDGRLVGLGGNDLAAILRMYSSEEISRIELITNPSSKYDAAGNAGIINIILKKNVQHGLNSTIGGYYRQAMYARRGLNGNINWRSRKLGVYIGYVYTNRNAYSEYLIGRNFAEQQSQLNQRYTTTSPHHTNSARINLDYYLTRRISVGVIGTFLLTKGQVAGQTTTTTLLVPTNALVATNQTASTLDERIDNYVFSAYAKHTVSAQQELVMQYDATSYEQRANQQINTTITPANPTLLIRSDLPARANIQAIRLDYTRPLGRQASLEAGLKSSWVNNQNALLYYKTASADSLNAQTSNRFAYTEQIAAAYASVRFQRSGWTFQTGLRYERTEATGHQTMPQDSTFRRQYDNLFPTLYIQRKLSETSLLKLTFTRRIDRPSYQDLNPFRYYVDPYTYKQGNPYLRPQFSNTLEFGYVYRDALSNTITYSQTTNAITPVVRQDNATLTTYQTTDNLATQRTIGWTGIFPVPVQKWWTSINYFNVTHREYSSFFLNQPLALSQTTFLGNSTNNFTLGNDWSATITGFYQSHSLFGIMSIAPIWGVSIGAQKYFFHKAGTLKIDVSDLFWSTVSRMSLDFANIDTHVQTRSDSRSAMLSLSYRFGSSKVSSVMNRRSVTDDEKKRVKLGDQ